MDEAQKQAEKYLSKCTEYTDPYEHEKLVRHWEKKGDVAQSVVGDFIKRAGDPSGKRILDVGFGNGLYAVAFAKAGAQVFGLEVNEVLLGIAKENVNDAGILADLRLYDGGIFPYEDETFDYAFSVSVLEHVSDPSLMLSEASRVLNDNGTFYLAFPNRFSPKETHTGIWGLNYLPRSVAQLLLRTLWRRNTMEDINLHFVSYWKMKRMARRAGFRVRMEYGGNNIVKRILKRILGTLGMHHSAILRTVMVILVKRSI